MVRLQTTIAIKGLFKSIRLEWIVPHRHRITLLFACEHLSETIWKCSTHRGWVSTARNNAIQTTERRGVSLNWTIIVRINSWLCNIVVGLNGMEWRCRWCYLVNQWMLWLWLTISLDWWVNRESFLAIICRVIASYFDRTWSLSASLSSPPFAPPLLPPPLPLFLSLFSHSCR